MPNQLITTEKVESILAELDDAFYDIPFENSDYQNKVFVLAAQVTPARAYRSLGLKMFSKIRAVKEHMFNKEKEQIDIDEYNAKIAHPDTNQFDRRRAELELLKLQDGRAWGDKLLNDALHELNMLYVEFEKFPKYTREAFEREEQLHFEHKLDRQLKVPGPSESLVNMHQDAPGFDKMLSLAKAELGLLEKK